MSAWLTCGNLALSSWDRHDSLHSWWTERVATAVTHKKGLRSLIILVQWEIWMERNARIFQHKEQTVHRVSDKIKEKVATWIVAGEKHLESFIYAA